MSPLVNGDALERMVDSHVRATSRVARRIVDRGTDRMERATRRRTPVDTNPYRHRPERPRGSLRKSVHRLEGILMVAMATRDRWIGEVVSFDPIVRHVEFDTVPHEIRAKGGGRLLFQSRHGWTSDDGTYNPPGTWVSVEVVSHPGTKGQHMFSLGAFEAEREFDLDAAPELARWKREVESGRF